MMSEYELPLDSAWELPTDRLILSDTLGEGAFGRVLKADLCAADNKGPSITVAVKMLKGQCMVDKCELLVEDEA